MARDALGNPDCWRRGVVASAALLALILFSVLDARAMPTAAQQSCPNQSVPVSQIGHAGAGMGTLAVKLRQGQSEEIDFGRSITARTLTLYLALNTHGILCTVEGDVVTNPDNGQSSSLWDSTCDGFVPDVYVDTGPTSPR
jgi:hypothetical protein